MTTPHIAKLEWADIRKVLPNEAYDFTPWLADNLDLLADALGLEDLALVGTESSVEDFRLDILATGTDTSGEEISVVIENQYGATDHDHLGKLVTYAAKAAQDNERVLGVWVVEAPRSAHLAAVEFLNRVTTDAVGWFLVSARFVDGRTGTTSISRTTPSPTTSSAKRRSDRTARCRRSECRSWKRCSTRPMSRCATPGSGRCTSIRGGP